MTIKFAPIFPERLWKASIYWSKPISYEKARDQKRSVDGKAHFYKITGIKDGAAKLRYIGKTYRSEVWRRLNNYDHQQRLQKIRKGFSKLMVSHGMLNLKLWRKENDTPRYPSAKRIDEIESLLIYSNFDDSGINARKQRGHGITDHYMVTNKGNYKPLKRQVLLTIFVNNKLR